MPRASVYVVEAHSTGRSPRRYVAAILARYPKARLVVIAGNVRARRASFPLLRQGVKGLLKYSETAVYLPRTLREVAAGGFWVPRTLLSTFVDSTLEEIAAAPARRRPACA